MINQLRIPQLNMYEFWIVDEMAGETYSLSFTADNYVYDPETESHKFYRTGNLIREIFTRPMQIVVTPVDEDEIEMFLRDAENKAEA